MSERPKELCDMAMNPTELARRTPDGRMQLRQTPLRVSCDMENLVSADGNQIRVRFTFSVSALAAPAEQRMLSEVLMQEKPIVTAGDVASHFQAPLRAAANQIVETKLAAEILAAEGKPHWLEALQAAARRVAFACGVEVIAPFELMIESPTLERSRLTAMQRSLAEQQSAGQFERLQRATDLLRQFQSLQTTASDVSAGHLLQQIGPADRGSLLQTLLLASANEQKQKDLFAITGPHLARLDLTQEGLAPTLLSLPTVLGPLRSVQSLMIDGQLKLLIGARSGILVVDPTDPEAAVAYIGPQVESQLGYSSVQFSPATRVFAACHGDAGIVFWDEGQPAHASRVIRPDEIPAGESSSGPRHLTALGDGSYLFSANGQLVVLKESAMRVFPNHSRAEMVSINRIGQRVLTVLADGNICEVAGDCYDGLALHHQAGRVRSAAALPWLGEARLLLATEEGPIVCLGLEDDVVTQYLSAHHALRDVTASAERIVAISSDRQRLITWNSWDGKKPAAEIFLAGITRHRISDVCFA